MPIREQIVAEARSWIGTPFRWQACVKGVGADCKGLLVGVARALGMPEGDALHACIADYSARVDVRLLKAGLAATLAPTSEALPGDVLLLIVGRPPKPQHLAIVTGSGRMIHTYTRGPERVIEVPIGRSRAIDSIWTWPSLGGNADG